MIPYISFKDYQQLLYRGRTFKEGRDKLDIKQNGNVYEMTVAGDYTATFDVANNKMESSNLWCFKNTNLAGYGDISSVCYDGLPFTKVSSVRFEGEVKKTTIDFSKYHMKIYGDHQAVYVPLPFITDLFSSENILQGAYNHQDLFIFNMTENESLDDMGDVYYNGMYSKPLVQEYTDFVYNELCLNYDLLLGRPGRSSLEVYYDLSKGLDETLKSRPLGQTIINYMKSNDLTKFLVGETLFGYLHEDGGHSHFSPLNVYYTDPKTQTVKTPSWLNDKLKSDAKALLQQISDKKYEELINYDVPFNERSRVYSAREHKVSFSKAPFLVCSRLL